MKENRFSVAPSRGGNNKNQQPSNIKANYQSNPLNDSKSRKSTHPMISWRGATFSSINKSADPRPFKDPSFQEECIKKIIDFLIKQAYDRTLTKKDLMSPQAKDFTNLFCFILSKIRPDWNFSINKIDEDIIPILNELRYPGFINKSHLIAVGAPNTWPHLLAVLAWLVELADYLYYDSVLEIEEEKKIFKDKKEGLSNMESPDEVEKIFERDYRDFLNDGFKQSVNKGDSFLAVEALQNKVGDLIKINYINTDKLINDAKNLEKLCEDLEKNNPSLIEAQLSFDRANGELNLTKSSLNQQEKKLIEISNLLENKTKVYESKCEKNKETIRINEELDQIIKSQKVSYEDFEKLKHNKIQLEKQIQVLNTKKSELENFIWNTNNNIDGMTSKLNSKIKNIKQISDRINLGEIIPIEITSYINNILQLNLNDANQAYSEINSQLASLINLKVKEIKDREEFHINLKSELLKIDDKINESNEFFIHKESEHERINNTLTLEKEKYSQICLQKNEEIKKVNETTQKTLNALSEKEKEFDETKSFEVMLEMKYREEEDMTDRFIKDLENEYVETFKEADKIKKENTMEIRKTQKSILKIFENLKNTMNG
jgi:SMC interacting uncharacterized protein involved in chromosome segregation